MLDIQYIRQNKEKVAAAAKNKNLDLDIEGLLAKDAERVKLLQEIEELQSLKNDINDLIRQAKTDEERQEVIEKGKDIEKQLEEREPAFQAVKQAYEVLMARVPNIPTEDTPIGTDETGNTVLRTVGEPPQFEFAPKEHWQLGEALDLIDSERAVRISGSRFVYLKNELVLMEFGLLQVTLGLLTNEAELRHIIEEAKLAVPTKPFAPVLPPLMIKTEVMQKMARLEPREERYGLPEDDLYLIGSAEHSLGPMHMNETLAEAQLPLRYVGFSSAFRREAGTYGKDMKGILRLHQFDKLEMESFTLPEHSRAEHDLFVAVQEHLTKLLGLPYQVVLKCTGDMGMPNARAVDIETWLPGQGKYRETHTADLMTDYQARRLNTKVKRTDGKVEILHMNDGTAFAGRTLIALLENYQRADGTVVVPEILRPYVGKGLIEPKQAGLA